MITFGPVPSRRLGRSVGVNNIPPKVCSYGCIYCQVGSTPERETRRRPFYPPEEIVAEVEARLRGASDRGERVDYLTFVPDGEPTLDLHLGETIASLRRFGVPIAVISNGSLLWDPGAAAAAAAADWVSVKVDAVTEEVWRRIDHPAPDLDLGRVLDGIRGFADAFEGTLCTETMLVSRVNDRPEIVEEVARFLSGLPVATAYLAVPTRPPAMPGVRAPDEASLNRAHGVFRRHLERVEYLVGYEGDAFASTGDLAADVLSIAAVHPLRASAVERMVAERGGAWDTIEGLVAAGSLVATDYGGERFYVRRYAAS
ncbi:MAG: radical SAM protein [Actinobacteria bacterium]|nr:radical SAM protein [Actinomycetota bacterium]